MIASVGAALTGPAVPAPLGLGPTFRRVQAYLRATVVNVCRHWQRHKGVERAKLPLIATFDSVDFVAHELADAVRTLPYRQRAVVVLRYYADLSEAEIAQDPSASRRCGAEHRHPRRLHGRDDPGDIRLQRL
jgi:hypothetical protein